MFHNLLTSKDTIISTLSLQSSHQSFEAIQKEKVNPEIRISDYDKCFQQDIDKTEMFVNFIDYKISISSLLHIVKTRWLFCVFFF